MHPVTDRGRSQNRLSLFAVVSFDGRKRHLHGEKSKNYHTDGFDPLISLQTHHGSSRLDPGLTELFPDKHNANAPRNATDNLGMDTNVDLPNIEPANLRTFVLSLCLNN